MPLVDREILEWVDGLLQCAGGVCAAALVYSIVRRRLKSRSRAIQHSTADSPIPETLAPANQADLVERVLTDPLFLEVRPSQGGPRVEHLALFVAHFLLPAAVVLTTFGGSAQPVTGSNDWHVLHLLTSASALLVAACVGLVLKQRPSFEATAAALPWRISLATVAGGVLIAFFLCFPQLKAAQDIWRWSSAATSQPTHAIIEAIQKSEWGAWGAVCLTVSAVLVAPVSEELLVRGLLLGILWHYTGLAWFSILASAVFFGFMHYSQPQDVIPLITFGVLLGAIRFRTRRLLTCIAVHALFNLRTMAFVLLNPDMARTAN